MAPVRTVLRRLLASVLLAVVLVFVPTSEEPSMAPVRTFPILQYVGVGLTAERPATPERNMVGWFATDTGVFSVAKADLTWVVNTAVASNLPMQTNLEFYRNPATAFTGSTGSSEYIYPGSAASASVQVIHAELLQGREILFARWVLVWNPNTAGAATGARLITFTGEDPTQVEIARIEVASYQSPRVNDVDLTTAIQAILDGGVLTFVGHQTIGNGSNAALIYGSWIEIVWQ